MRARERVRMAAKNAATCEILGIARLRGHCVLHDNAIRLLLLLNGGWRPWIHTVADPSLS